MDARLLDAKGVLDGTPRFFLPGCHPATLRMRQSLAKLLQHQQLVRGDPATTEMVDYLKDRLAMFEEQESVAKADYLRMLDRGSR